MKRQQRSLFKLFIPVLAIFVAIQSLNLAARQKARVAEIANNEMAADRAIGIIRERIEQIGHNLNDIATVITRAHATEASSTSAFHNFLGKSRFFTEVTAMDGTIVVSGVAQDDLGDFSEMLDADPDRRALGYAPFKPDTQAGGTEVALVTMVEPLNDYAKSEIGANILDGPLRDTYLGAVATGEMRLSDPHEFVPNDLMIAAFSPYAIGNSHSHGAIVTVFQMSELLLWIEEDLSSLHQEIEIYDSGATDTSPDLQTGPVLLAKRSSSRVHDHVDHPNMVVRDISIGGRNWQFRMWPEKPVLETWSIDAMFWMAIIIALLSGILLYRLNRNSQILENLVAKRTKSLKLAALRLEREKQIAHAAATHDALTGLLNERGLGQKHIFEQSPNGPPVERAILSIDLDRFKEINDTTGYQTGNLLLVHVAEFLTQIAPANSHIARFGGDEFLILASISEDEACFLATEIVAWANQPQTVDGRVIRFGASIGIAFDQDGQARLETLLADASISLSAAKRDGRGQFRLYDAKMKADTVATKTLADELWRALEEDEFEPYFQTQHFAGDHAVSGVEVLIRWRHPTKGILPPAAFLDVAETIGILGEIDAIALRKSGEIVARLEAEGYFVPKISVNVSMERLRDQELLFAIECLPALQAQLTFEILETVFIDDLDASFKFLLQQLEAKGIGIEIDDFGSGRASILGLTQIEPSRLKIDKALVMPLLDRPEQKALLKSIVAMGRALKIGVTAEGVETLAHARILEEIGVDTLQGYYFSKPFPASQLVNIFHRRAA